LNEIQLTFFVNVFERLKKAFATFITFLTFFVFLSETFFYIYALHTSKIPWLHTAIHLLLVLLAPRARSRLYQSQRATYIKLLTYLPTYIPGLLWGLDCLFLHPYPYGNSHGNRHTHGSPAK